MAETEWEVADIKSRYGVTPVELLEGHGLLGPGFVAVHGVHLTEADREALAVDRHSGCALPGVQHEAGFRGSSSDRTL